ncbi:MAG: outer membrane beta-barrel protein, partial [Pyrinomonadaceae bacterium]|nr:outer membrane beta-barrel protein [Sphingobacteriaceae bacterium]
MKNLFLVLTVFLLSGNIVAQTPSAPSTGREVSGIVKDTTDNGVIGAIVILSTGTDSVKRSTNANGVFVFKNVATGQFTITVRSIGYRNFNKRFLYNDGATKLVLDPIILKETANQLNTVIINGTPTITYKEDTVEYRASDYVMKPNASVEDLVKKLEGVEVGNDGSVTHQGIAVTRAKLNGKAVGGADLASTLQNLPADIVEKIQMVDDYGDQAARTGIKDGDPERILNIVTRADRSVGNRLQADAGIGNNERYTSRLNLNRFNGNEQIMVNGNFNNTVTGVASSGGGAQSSGGTSGGGGGRQGGDGGGRQGGGGQSGGGGFQSGSGTSGGGGTSGSGGISTSGGTRISYSDTWSKKLEFNGNYSFSGSNTNSLISSETQRVYQKFGNVLEAEDGNRENGSNTHNFGAELRYQIDSTNYLQVSPSLGFSSGNNLNQGLVLSSGGIKQEVRNLSEDDRKAPNYGLTSLYVHNFAKPSRRISFQFSANISATDRDRVTDNQYKFYNPQTGDFLSDSVANLLINNGQTNNSYRASLTFSEPLSVTSRIEFNGQINKRDYDNSQITENFVNGQFVRSNSLSKIFNYSFVEQRYALNYRYLKGKYNVSLGFTAVPALLSGFSETLNTETSRNSLNVIPIARAEYQWSRQKRFNISYAGSPQEPTFDQIQDVPDISNPQNVVYGNPGLKAQFRHTISTGFNNYITNSKVNFSVNAQATKTENKVTRNTVELDASRGTRATYYGNANGDYSLNGNYSISKSFGNPRKYQIGLNGRANFGNSVTMNNGIQNVSRVTTLNQSLGIQLYPTKWLELVPNIRYNILKSEYTLNSTNSITKTWAISTQGR